MNGERISWYGNNKFNCEPRRISVYHYCALTNWLIISRLFYIVQKWNFKNRRQLNSYSSKITKIDSCAMNIFTYKFNFQLLLKTHIQQIKKREKKKRRKEFQTFKCCFLSFTNDSTSTASKFTSRTHRCDTLILLDLEASELRESDRAAARNGGSGDRVQGSRRDNGGAWYD